MNEASGASSTKHEAKGRKKSQKVTRGPRQEKIVVNHDALLNEAIPQDLTDNLQASLVI